MTEIVLGIKITADGKSATAELTSIDGEVQKLGRSAAGATSGVNTLGKGMDFLGRSSSAANKEIGNSVSVITGRAIPALKDTAGAADKAGSSMTGMAKAAGALVGILAGSAIVGYARKIIEASDQMASMDARLKLVTNSAQQYLAVQAELYQQAQAVGGDLAAQADLYAKLARATEGTNRPARDLLTITDVVAKNLRISGTAASAASGAMLQLGQAAGSGKVQAEEFNSMLDGMPTLVQGVAKALGYTTAELKNLVNQGRITSEQWLDAMVKMKGSTDQQAGAMASTFEQAMQRMTNSFLKFNAEVANQSGISDFFKALANGLSNYLDRWTENTDPIKSAVHAVEDAQQKLSDLKERFSKGLVGPQFQEMELARAQKELDEAESNLRRIQPAAKAASDSLSEGFGKTAYAIADVGKKADATMAEIVAQSKKAGSEIALNLAVAQHESGFRQYDKNGNVLGSSAGPSSAKGIYQLINSTASAQHVDASNPFENIKGGIGLLDQLQGKYKSLAQAVAAYYIGEGKVDEMLRKRGSLDLSFIPKGNTTSLGAYLADVQKRFDTFKAQFPTKLEFWDEGTLKQQQQSEKQLFEAAIASAEAAGRAQATVAKSVLAVDVETLQQRTAAYQSYAKAAAGDLKGDQKIQFLQQSFETERNLIQQSTELKLRAIEIEKQATQGELAGIQQQLAARQQLGLSDIQVIQLQDQQRQKEAELASLTQQSNAIRIAGAGEIVQAMQAANEAQAAEVENIQQASAAREDYLAKLDAQIQALQTGNEALAGEAELHRLTAGMMADQAQAFENLVRSKQSQINDLKKAQEDQKKSEKAVADQVLRTGQYFQAMVRQAQAAATGMSQAFGKTGQALGQLVVGLAQAQETSFQIHQEMQARLKSAGGDPEKEAQIRMQAANQELAAQINNYGNLTAAAQGFFEEGTSGYNAMANATKAFRLMELALTLANYIQMATAGAAYTAQDVMQSSVRATAKGTEGVANQLAGGDPYSAIPRALAVAAILAALGIGVASFAGGGGSGGTMNRYKDGARNKGTVLGDSEAASESIANSLEILKNNSSTDLDYSAKMTRSLQNIEYSMAGVARSVLFNVNALSGLGGATPKAPGSPVSSFDPLQGAIGSILVSASAKIKDWGIGAFPQALLDVLKNGALELKTFTDVEFKRSLFGLIDLSKKTKTYLGDASTETEREFGRVIISLVDALKEGAKSFGIGGDEMIRKLHDFQIQWDAQSLKDLKGEDLQKAIEAQFSAIADRMAAALHIDQLDQFQQVGEGMFETLTRVASGINTARAELEALNVRMIDYRDITYKQGDVAGELARQSIIAFEGAGSAIGKFMQDAVGSIDDILSTYRDLIAIRDIMRGAGLDFKNVTRDMTEAVGGVSKLRDAVEAFRDNFYSQGAQLGMDLQGLARQFGALGYAIPKSKDEFRGLVESIDTSTESGQKLFARLVALSEAFAQAADSAKELEDLYQSYTDPLSSVKEPLQKVIDDFKAILDGKLGQIKADFDNRAARAKTEAHKPYEEIIGRLSGTASARQAEIDANLGFLQATNDRIAQLQGLLAQWSGAKGAAGYVAAWQQELDALQAQARALTQNITSSTAEINSINAEIQRLKDEMAAGDKDIDAGLAKERLAELRRQKKEILKAEGDALLQTLRDTWSQMIDAIRAARRSLNQQIAELQGPAALRDFTRNQANRSFRSAINYHGDDPEEAIRRIQQAQSDVMADYEQQLARINNQIERQSAALERESQREIDRINRRTQRRIDKINEELEAEIEALNDATNAQIEAINEATNAQIEAITQEQEAALKALSKRHESELKALQQQVDTARQLRDALKSIAEYAKSLKVGELAAASPEDKLAEAKRQYEDLVARARGGDAEAAAKVREASETYLRLAQPYFGGGPQYAQIFQSVQQTLEQLGQMQTTDPDSVQSHIDALREQQSAEAEALRESFQNRIEGVRKAAEGQIEAVRKGAEATEIALRKAAENQIQEIQKAADKKIRTIERETRNAIRDLSDPEKNDALRKLRERTVERLKELRDKLEEEEAKAREKMKELIDEVRDLGVLNRAQLRQLNKMAEKMGAGIVDPPKFASGGMAKSGWAVVGEVGPELVRFGAPNNQIYSASQTRQILSGGDKDELQAIREELRALVTTQSAANPRMAGALERIEARLNSLERQQRIKPAA